MKQIILSCLIALILNGGLQTKADDGSEAPGLNGAVYTMDNAASGNRVLSFQRDADGSLSPSASDPTGGLGTGSGLSSQGAILLTRDGQWLFVSNAGSDEISVFAVSRNGLQLADKVGSGGHTPISLTLDQDLLYVLNAGGAGGGQDTITGFHFDKGHLTAIPGSTQTLSADNTGPAQVSFTSDGQVLVVTEKSTSIIDTFTVDDHGLPENHKMFASPAATPFGFAAGRRNRIFVSNAAGPSSMSSYQILEDGDVEAISSPVVTSQNAACWVVLTDNNRFAYTANAGSGSISGFRVDPHGNLELLDLDGRTGVTGDGSHPIDMALSNNGRFLYSLNSGNGTISAFRVEADGSLQSLGNLSGISTAASGLAAR
jgi:6-phosphogluconolactonase (cycloisomerase 2 family)